MTENPNESQVPKPPVNPDEPPVADTSWSPYDKIPEYGTEPGAAPGTGPGTHPGTGPDAKPDAKAAWSEAGDSLSGLGSKLRRHYEDQAGTPPGQGGSEVKDAAKKLGEAVQNAFEALGNASKDPEVKDDVRKVGRSVSDALAGTLAGLSGELRKTFGRDADKPADKPTDRPGGTQDS